MAADPRNGFGDAFGLAPPGRGGLDAAFSRGELSRRMEAPGREPLDAVGMLRTAGMDELGDALANIQLQMDELRKLIFKARISAGKKQA